MNTSSARRRARAHPRPAASSRASERVAEADSLYVLFAAAVVAVWSMISFLVATVGLTTVIAGGTPAQCDAGCYGGIIFRLAFGFGMIIVGMLLALTARGLWKHKRWGWWWSVIFSMLTIGIIAAVYTTQHLDVFISGFTLAFGPLPALILLSRKAARVACGISRV